MISKKLKPIGPLRKETSSKIILDDIWASLPLIKIKRLVPRISLCAIIFQLAFQGTDAEHVVKESCKYYGESGFCTAKALKTYYRSDNHQQEVQHRLQKKLNNLKYNQDPESFESIQSYTNEFKTTYKRLKMANEYWPSTKRKAEYLRNINIAYGHPLMTMKPIVVRIIISLSSLPLT